MWEMVRVQGEIAGGRRYSRGGAEWEQVRLDAEFKVQILRPAVISDYEALPNALAYRIWLSANNAPIPGSLSHPKFPLHLVVGAKR